MVDRRRRVRGARPKKRRHRRPLLPPPGGEVRFAEKQVRACVGKVVFGSEAEANRFCVARNMAPGCYRCEFCGSIHLTSRSRGEEDL